MTTPSPLTVDDLLADIRLPLGGRFFEQVRTPIEAHIDAAFSKLANEASEFADAELTNAGLPARATYRAVRRSLSPISFSGVNVGGVYSVLVVAFGRRPAFAPTSPLLEYRYGYVLLCEFEVSDTAGQKSQYVFVQKDLLGDPLEEIAPPIHKEMSVINFLEPFLRPVPSGGSPLAPRLERLSMKVMASARGEVTRKIVEAYDVEAATSSLGLHRVVPGSMTIAIPRGTRISTVSVNPARQSVRASNGRRAFQTVIDWAAGGAAVFHSARGAIRSSSSFIGEMAQPVGSIKGLVPLSVMVERHALDWILKRHSDETAEVWAARKHTPPGWDLPDILDALSELEVLPAPKRLDGTKIVPADSELEAYYDVKAPQFPEAAGLRLCVSKQSCKLILPACLGGLAVPNSAGPPDGFSEIVNRFKAFRVLLGSGDVLYCSDGAYRANNLALAVGQLTKIFKVIPNVGSVHTEKGSAGVGAVTFDSTSSFAAIEGYFKSKCDILVCDDGPTEWCDFLAISTTSLSMHWIHAKVQSIEEPAKRASRKQARRDARAAAAAGKLAPAIPPKVTMPVSAAPSQSASALEEVIGQAIKNLARLRIPATHGDFAGKCAEWATATCSLLGPAEIPRLVHPTTRIAANDIAAAFARVAQDPLASIEVAIVVPNYSLSNLGAAFGLIATGGAPASVLQMFWLLSGFMHSCLEVGARPVVYLDS